MAKGHDNNPNSIDGSEEKKSDPNSDSEDEEESKKKAEEMMEKLGVIADGKIPYRIITETPNIQGAGAQGQFFMKIEGTKGITDEFMVATNGFHDGETDIANVR